MTPAPDEIYMRRALRLARHGELDASPNPMVGAVIVTPEGRIIGEGWHRKYGEGHAEVNAIASVSDESLLRECTMYVTLEPCSHYGKTPPCAELIIRKRIPRVVIGTADPFAKVSGRGIAMLRDAGVDVTVGMLQDECLELNSKFFTAHTLHRPYITLKWAESADGYIDGKISTPLTSVEVHRLRALHDAILVGSNTWLADRPALTVRHYAGHSPQRVMLDRRGRLYGRQECDDIIILSSYTSLTEAMTLLYERNITSVLVEGGARVLEAFLREHLYDTIRIERSAGRICGNIKAPELPSALKVISMRIVDNNQIITLQ